MSIVEAIAHHKRGGSSRAALFRALVEHTGWLVPSKPTEDGSASIWMFPGTTGAMWVVAFTDQQAMHAYAANSGVTIGASHFVTRGRSLINGMPANVAGIGIDLASPHGIAIYPQELPALRTVGQATEIEDILHGRSKRENTWARLRNYPAYQICLGDTGKLLMAPDSQGRSLAAVFTSQDALENFMSEFPEVTATPTVVDGVALWTRMSTANIDGIVFNCRGPNTRALDKAFAKLALDGVDKSTEPAPTTSAPAPAEFGAPMTAPEPRRAVDLSPMKPRAPRDAASQAAAAPKSVAAPSARPLEYRPMIVRQELAQAQPGIVQRALLPNKDPTQPIVSPMVCLAAKSPDGKIVYATPKALGTRSLDELVVEGCAALMREAPPVLNVEKTSAGTTASLEGEHATEALLVPKLMLDLAKSLGSDTIAVAFPIRGVVVATPMVDMNGVVRMLQMAEDTYQRAGATGVSPFTMVVKEGRVQGRIVIQRPDEKAAEGPFRARSLAECGLYSNLRDYPVRGRQENITTDGNDVVVQYDCQGESGPTKRIEFRITKADMAATSHQGPITYGHGGAPSKLVCAGQFFAMAEGFAKASPGNVAGMDKASGMMAMRTIERAAACMDEVIKFIPAGQEMVPEEAFFTSTGQKTRAEQPSGRWSRARLGAIGGAYRRIADGFRKTAHESGWLY